MRRRSWLRLGGLCGTLAVLSACGGGGGAGGGGGGGTLVPDDTYNFAAAGVEPGVATRAPGRGLINGTATTAAGAPAANVTVTLQRLVTRAVGVGSATTQTGLDGSFVFGNVEPGTYRLSIAGQTQDITVNADQDSQVVFTNVPGSGGTGTSRYKWTLMVFVNADNDLEPFAIEDINEMEQLSASQDVAIVVLMDRARGFDTTNGNWTDARRFRVLPDNNPTLMTSALAPSEGGSAEVLGELDTGRASTVSAFIQWAQQNYPADHYLVDLWNHGAGWRDSLRSARGDRGVLFDDTQGTFVTTPQLNAALSGLAPLDIVAIDSSLMQMLEVAYQIRNQAQVIVASEESPPGEGYPYDRIFAGVIANPDMDAETFAAQIVNTYVDFEGQRSQVTNSALRGSQLDALRAAVSNYADVLRAKDAAFHQQIATARTQAQRYGSGNSLYEGYRDLGNFVDRVATATGDADLLAAGNAVKAALQAALVAERHAGSGMAGSTGVSIFVPNLSDWTDLRALYRETAFGQDSRWDEWLDLFYGL